MKYTKVALPFAAFLFGVACHSFEAKTPSGFAELEPSRSQEYRAVHPDGLVVVVRVEDNPKGGNVAFWSRAIGNQLRLSKGYRLIEEKPLQSANAVPGQLLEFGHDEGKAPHLYRVAVFPKEDNLLIVEQGGKADLVTKHRAELDAFLTTLEVK